MSPTSSYPVLMTSEVGRTSAFYREHFDFQPTFEADWYVSLANGDWELAILDSSHETIPAAFRNRSASGILLNIEVDDVDAQYRRLVVDGRLEAVLPIRSEAFGQRHFIIEAPDGVLVDVITPIEPTGEFASQPG